MTATFNLPAVRIPLLLAVAAFAACTSVHVITESDKNVLVTFADFPDLVRDIDNPSSYESFQKQKIHGSWSLHYTFRVGPKPLENLFIGNSIDKYTNKSTAKTVSDKIIPGLLQMFHNWGFRVREHPNFFPYGDYSSFYTIYDGDHPVGTYYTMRDGGIFYYLIIIQKYFSDAEEWREFIMPKLAQLASHDFRSGRL